MNHSILTEISTTRHRDKSHISTYLQAEQGREEAEVTCEGNAELGGCSAKIAVLKVYICLEESRYQYIGYGWCY